MHLQLSTPGEEANFNFASLIIGFQRHNKENLSALQQAVAWEPGQEIDARGFVYRSLLKREATLLGHDDNQMGMAVALSRLSGHIRMA